MDIESLGEKRIGWLIENGYVHDVAEIYELPQHRDRLGTSEHFGVKPKRKADGEERVPGKALENLFAAIEASKQRGLPALLTGLGIRHVGGEVATLLATRFGSLSARCSRRKSRRSRRSTASAR